MAQDWPEASIAGGAEVVRCGARKALLSQLALQMRSPRGVVEVIAGSSSKPLPEVRRVLSRRNPGPVQRTTQPTPRARPAPLEQRLGAIEGWVRERGWLELRRSDSTSGSDGSGGELLRLDPGCHRFDVLGVAEPDPKRTPDIDADLVTLGNQLIAQDRSENADATLGHCTGEQSLVKLRYAGAAPDTEVVLAHARSALPAGLPEAWGPFARARMAESLSAYRFGKLEGHPVYASLGVQGVTLLPLEVEPGACYLVGLAVIQGSASGLTLAARADPELAENYGGPEARGSVLAFCAGHERAVLEVEARGSAIAWLLGVWQTARIAIGAVRQ
jgi:hypothetical protein